MQRDLELEKRLAEGWMPADLGKTFQYFLARSQHAADLEKAFVAELEEWNVAFKVTHPEGSPPLCCKDAKLLKAIFMFDPGDFDEDEDHRTDAGGRADNYKPLGGPHVKGA